MSDCPYHADHENRMKNMEGEIKEVKKSQMNPAIWVALIGGVTTIMSSIGAFCGIITVAYLKSKGYMP